MSLSALSDIFSPSDILSETKLKPWWESIREYCVRGMVVIVLLIIYSVELTSLHCIPQKGESGTSACVKTLTNPETSFVNNVCYEQVEFYRKNVGYIALLMTVAIYFFYEWWLIIPFVKNKFATMRNIDNSLKELKLISEQIKNLALKPSKQMDFDSHHADAEADTKSNVAVVRKACRSLWVPTKKIWYITLSYIGREIMALALIIVCISLISLYVGEINDIDVIFSCDAGNTTLVAVGCKHFICSYQASTKVFFFVIMYLVALILQALILLCTLVMVMKRFGITKDNELIIFFGKHSMELQEVEALQSIITEDNYKIMIRYIEKAFKISDLDYVNIFSNLNKENEDRVLDHIETKIKELEPQDGHDRMIDDQLFASFSRYCYLYGLTRYYIQLHVAYYKKYNIEDHCDDTCRCIHFQSSPAIITHHLETWFKMIIDMKSLNEDDSYKFCLVLNHVAFLSSQIAYTYMPKEFNNKVLYLAKELKQQFQANVVSTALLQLVENSIIYGQTVLKAISKNPKLELDFSLVSQLICKYPESLKNCTITDDRKVCLISDKDANKLSYKKLSKIFLDEKKYEKLVYLHTRYMGKLKCGTYDYNNSDCGCKEVPFELGCVDDQGNSLMFYVLAYYKGSIKFFGSPLSGIDLEAQQKIRHIVVEHFLSCAKPPSDTSNKKIVIYKDSDLKSVTESGVDFVITKTDRFQDDIIDLLKLLHKYKYVCSPELISNALINHLRNRYSLGKYKGFIIIHLQFNKFKGIVNYKDNQCGCADHLELKLEDIFVTLIQCESDMPDQYWELTEHILLFGKDENRRQVMLVAGENYITAAEYVVDLNSPLRYKASMLRLLIKHGYSTKEECIEKINRKGCNLTVKDLEDAMRDFEERENEGSSYENAENESLSLLANQNIV